MVVAQCNCHGDNHHFQLTAAQSIAYRRAHQTTALHHWPPAPLSIANTHALYTCTHARTCVKLRIATFMQSEIWSDALLVSLLRRLLMSPVLVVSKNAMSRRTRAANSWRRSLRFKRAEDSCKVIGVRLLVCTHWGHTHIYARHMCVRNMGVHLLVRICWHAYGKSM